MSLNKIGQLPLVSQMGANVASLNIVAFFNSAEGEKECGCGSGMLTLPLFYLTFFPTCRADNT